MCLLHVLPEHTSGLCPFSLSGSPSGRQSPAKLSGSLGQTPEGAHWQHDLQTKIMCLELLLHHHHPASAASEQLQPWISLFIWPFALLSGSHAGPFKTQGHINAYSDVLWLLTDRSGTNQPMTYKWKFLKITENRETISWIQFWVLRLNYLPIMNTMKI